MCSSDLDDVLKITTATKESDRMFTRTYPVRDLYTGRPGAKDDAAKKTEGREIRRFDDLPQAIEQIVPDSWEVLSGPGSFTYVKDTGSLVIRQTWSIHRKIVQLLRDLREAKRLPKRQKT